MDGWVWGGGYGGYGVLGVEGWFEAKELALTVVITLTTSEDLEKDM